MYQRSLVGSWILCVLVVSQATAEMDVFLGWDKQIFSSYVLSTSTVERKVDAEDETRLGDVRGLMGVVVQANEDDEPIRVTIVCDEFIEPSEFSGVLADEGETYRISPRIRYRFEKLSHCRQATPANVTIRIEQGENEVVEVSETVTFRSIHDCPFLVQEGDKLIEMDCNFAAYVNEQHPYVDKLLREALDIGVVDRFVGYQEGNEESVLRQVYALWDLLVCRDVRYSSITATSAVSKTPRLSTRPFARRYHQQYASQLRGWIRTICVDASQDRHSFYVGIDSDSLLCRLLERLEATKILWVGNDVGGPRRGCP